MWIAMYQVASQAGHYNASKEGHYNARGTL
jgi:hypothetical protein